MLSNERTHELSEKFMGAIYNFYGSVMDAEPACMSVDLYCDSIVVDLYDHLPDKDTEVLIENLCLSGQSKEVRKCKH